ncbi:alternative ribosome rescue aminoacyl-tRNA hydrolase ArfB [Glycomyces terrestris]|uniref:Aminoacyl-tRNA hydrolase n=1 Tax=Glycomyces terrestris TaxID=2493553 RepID=A0A426UVW8_9ACTN|nr:alternative ribosome rescue aminoacyl-tRNA hydrolase ArfB [Glycomyces terrestris]RRR98321.1 aminoacyl-tRNA hydrolase [Glycomyces terrestris]
MPVTVTDKYAIPDAELRWRFSRSSGPGGQGVNTTDSRVELVFDLAGTAVFPPVLRERALARLQSRLVEGTIVIAASEFRSQLRNREAAAERLGDLLRRAIAAPPPARKATKPSKGQKRRRLEDKKRRGEVKRLRRDTGD